MLTWHWNKVLGTMKTKSGAAKRLYQGNCLAVLGVYESPAPYNDLEKPGYVVYGEFWNDKEHLKNCLDDGLYDDVESLELNSAFWDKDMQSIFNLFRKRGIPVTVRRFEPVSQQ